MFNQIMQFLGSGVSAVLQWFDMVLDATGMRGFLMAFIFMALAYKFLIAPFAGSGGVGGADSLGVNDGYYKRQRQSDRQLKNDYYRSRLGGSSQPQLPNGRKR